MAKTYNYPDYPKAVMYDRLVRVRSGHSRGHRLQSAKSRHRST
jgi:hypothetical protein